MDLGRIYGEALFKDKIIITNEKIEIIENNKVLEILFIEWLKRGYIWKTW